MGSPGIVSVPPRWKLWIETLEPVQPFARGPPGTWAGALHSFHEANSSPSSLCLLVAHSLSDAPKLLLNEALVFKICFYSKRSLFSAPTAPLPPSENLPLHKWTHVWMSMTAQTSCRAGSARGQSSFYSSIGADDFLLKEWMNEFKVNWIFIQLSHLWTCHN